MPNLFQDEVNTIGLTAKLTNSLIEIVGDDDLLNMAFTAAAFGFALPFSGKGEEAASEAKTEETVEQPY